MKNFLKSPAHQHRSPEVRLEWLRSPEAQSEEGQTIAEHMAQQDESIDVRIAAIERLIDLQVLRALAENRLGEQAARLSDAAIERLQQRIAEGAISDIGLRGLLSSLSPYLGLYAALHGPNSGQRQMAIAELQEENELLQVACESRVHEDREQAATRIETPDALRTLLATTRDKDKSVARLAQQRLDQIDNLEREHQAEQHALDQTVSGMEQLAETVWSPQTAGRRAMFSERWQQLPEALREAQQVRFDTALAKVDEQLAQHAQSQQQVAVDDHQQSQASEFSEEGGSDDSSPAKVSADEAAAISRSADEVTAQVPVNVKPEHEAAALALLKNPAFKDDWQRSSTSALADLPRLAADLQSPGTDAGSQNASPLKAYVESVAVLFDPPFDTRKARPEALEQRATRLEKLCDIEQTAPVLASQALNLSTHTWFGELQQHLADVNRRIPLAQQESADRVRATFQQLDSLESQIKDGQWSAANTLFKRVQKKVKSMESAERKQLDSRFTELEKKLGEMADWQDYATRPKLEALCDEMETLAAGTHDPRALAKKVRDIQKRWKALGVSRASNELWSRFHAAGDLAYQPYQNWMALKEQERGVKDAEREKLLTRLDAESAKLDADADTAALRKLVNHSVRDWKATRVLGVRANAGLEKRFSNALAPFREKLEGLTNESQVEKEALIEKAAALASGEINAHAVNQARNLFAAWKQSGQANRKVDGKLWKEFKGHIDAIYDQKRAQDSERRKADHAHVDRAREIISELRKLSRADTVDDNAVQVLADEFRSLEKFPDGPRKRLMSDFNKALDSCSAARSRADKRRQQAGVEEVKRLLGLVEQLEAVVETAEDADSARTAVLEHWDDAVATPPKDALMALEARRDKAIAHLDTGSKPDYVEAETQRRDLLIRMEVIAGVDTPEEDKARRMQYQLAHLQEGMMAAGDDDAKARLHDLEIEWLATAPASIAVRDALGSRFLKAQGR